MSAIARSSSDFGVPDFCKSSRFKISVVGSLVSLWAWGWGWGCVAAPWASSFHGHGYDHRSQLITTVAAPMIERREKKNKRVSGCERSGERWGAFKGDVGGGKQRPAKWRRRFRILIYVVRGAGSKCRATCVLPSPTLLHLISTWRSFIYPLLLSFGLKPWPRHNVLIYDGWSRAMTQVAN